MNFGEKYAAGTMPCATARLGRGQAFGTFGELLQGVLPGDNLDFLVTLPVDRKARAIFIAQPDRESVSVLPKHKRKSQQLAQEILRHLQLPPGGLLMIESDLPEGKGMASSSADLVATARAVEDCYGAKISVPQLQELLRGIEPTDGVMYPGIVAFYHRKVQLRQYLGALPDLTIIGVDEGGEVDTIEFNKLPKPFTAEEKDEYAALLDQLTEAIPERDLETIGRVSTRSAILNQKLRPKRSLAELLFLNQEIHGLGVAVAHSGTYLGILLSRADARFPAKLAATSTELARRFEHVTVFNSNSYGWEG